MALAHRESTHKTYDRAWELFLQFAFQHEVALPRLTELHLVDFIALLSWAGQAGSTIETYVSGVRHHLQLRRYDDFAKSFMVSLVLRGAKVANQQPDIRVPITIPMIDTMFQKMHLILASEYKRSLFHCMFLVAFHAMLHPGEITDSPHNLCIENVYFRMDGAMVVFLPSAKNNHSAIPQMVEVLPTPTFCPVAEVKQPTVPQSGTWPTFHSPGWYTSILCPISRCGSKVINFFGGSTRNHKTTWIQDWGGQSFVAAGVPGRSYKSQGQVVF